MLPDEHFVGFDVKVYGCFFQLDWPVSEAPRTVIDIINGSTPEQVFHGMFGHCLIPRCWSEDSRQVLFSSQARSRKVTGYLASVQVLFTVQSVCNG